MSKRTNFSMESQLQIKSNAILSLNNSAIHSQNLPFTKSKSNDKLDKSNVNTTNFSDFDLNTPCQYFKSSFARSLTLGTNEITSLDFSVNFEMDNNCLTSEEPETLTDDKNLLSQSQYTKVPDSKNVTADSKISNERCFKISDPFKNNTWLTSSKQECRNLIEKNRNLLNSCGINAIQLDIPETSPNIEAVILQTQVDTLLWQLKQVEASRKMYRAVMEEVIRFLERCHQKLDSLENNILSRSKSTHQVYQNHSKQIYNSTNTFSTPRTRSSTNIIDVNNDYLSTSKRNEDDFDTSSSTITYNNFRDLTWRRTPKRVVTLQLPSVESEKLSKEAFRLLRTAQNLLRTQEPPLTQAQVSTEASEILYDQNKKNPITRTTTPKSPYNIDPTYLTFSRKINTRGSHISLRSSTDDSVQSTSSSKNETDEDNYSTTLINKESVISSTTTEDESGFSSINSFQEIGIPLQSTILCASSTGNHFSGSALDLNNSILILDESDDLSSDTTYQESKNSTLKASQISDTNSIGLPLTNHRRCCSAPVVPPRLTTISSKCKDGSMVLWV